MKKNYSRIIEAVGLNIRIARKKARPTQAKLAKLSDVSRNQIAKIEQGKVVATTVTLDMICTVLRVELTKILEPYEDKRYLYKNTAQSSSPKIALLRVSESQSPQDTQELKKFETKGLAGGVKSAKIKARVINLQNRLYYTKVVMNRCKKSSA